MQSPQNAPKTKPFLTALSELIGPIEMDFGTEPIGIGLLTEHPGIIGVAALALGCSGSLIGVPIGLSLLVCGWGAVNDIVYAERRSKGAIPVATTWFNHPDEHEALPPSDHPQHDYQQQPQWSAPQGVSVPVTINNHLAPPQGRSSAAIKTASPPQSERRIEAPDLASYLDVQQRLQVLLRAMTESGFPIESLTYTPFVWCFGLS
jgi:hypothetical protein